MEGKMPISWTPAYVENQAAKSEIMLGKTWVKVAALLVECQMLFPQAAYTTVALMLEVFHGSTMILKTLLSIMVNIIFQELPFMLKA